MIAFKLKKLDYRGKITVIFAILSVIAGIIITLVVIPSIKKINKMKDEIEFQRSDLEKKYFKAQRSKKTVLNLVKTEEEMAKMNNAFINENRELEFITRLEDLASRNSLSQEINLAPKEKAEEGKPRVASLFIRVSGGHDNILRYLADIESLEYYINISGLELTSNSESGGYTLSLKALTYWSAF
jgi:Tfp pilus assembly protein PilO